MKAVMTVAARKPGQGQKASLVEASERPCQAEEIAGVSPSRVCPGPDRLSGEWKMSVREGTVATGEDLALCSAGEPLGGLELSPGFYRVEEGGACPQAAPKWVGLFWDPSVQFSSVAQLCPTLCNTMDCSTSGVPVHHQLPELTQTRVH